jgi:CRP-like cAMP-binding protein
MMLSSFPPAHPPHLRRYTFERRCLLPLRRDELWKIETGAVRALTWSEDGTVISLGLWGPEDVVGAVLSKAQPYQIESLTRVQATLQPVGTWPEVTEALVRHTQQLGEFLEMRQCKPIDASLLRLLGWLSKRFGRQVEQGQLIDLRLTHQEIAEMIGSNRVTVTRMLSTFEKQGIICRQRRNFVLVPDRQPFWHYEI